jgi:hypothetical protein
MHLLSQIIYSRNTLHVSDGLSIHHQELKLCIQQLLLQQVAAAFLHIPLLYRQFSAPGDGWKDHPKHAEHFTGINNLR